MAVPVWNLPLHAPPTVLATAAAARHPTSVDGVERYRLRDLWCVNLYDGTGTLTIDGQVLPIRPGHASVTPPDVDLEYHYEGPAVLAWVHFAPAAPALHEASAARVPAMQDLQDDFPVLRRLAERASSALAPAEARASAAVWELLWALADRWPAAVTGEIPVHHPAVTEGLRWIDRRLAEPIAVAELAEAVGISQTHFTRLFRAATGCTVLSYVRQRRVERARHLLAHSTLPIKAIAAQVGLADPHFFNKTMRRITGLAPGRLRRTTSHTM